MTFWEHLDELRKVLFKSAIIIVLLMMAIFMAKDFIFNKIIFAPTSSGFILYREIDKILALLGVSPLEPFNINLINIELSAQFFIHISTSFYFALVIATPYILYLLWGFVKPALYENEKSATVKAFSFAAVLFLLVFLLVIF
jgi:Sec-independent protein secretion pathway component TatC